MTTAISSRIYQGVPARSEGKRRAIHACRCLGRAGPGKAGHGKQGRRDLPHAQSHQPYEDRDQYSRYKTEPYVIAADVYAVSPHAGRGGWTWYTGAAGWLYRVGLEYIAGFMKKGEKLYIDPCIPGSWRSFTITYRYKNAVYNIEIRNPDGSCSGVSHMIVDGRVSNEGFVELSTDGVHNVEVIMGVPYHLPAGPGPGEAGLKSGAGKGPGYAEPGCGTCGDHGCAECGCR